VMVRGDEGADRQVDDRQQAWASPVSHGAVIPAAPAGKPP
jgi:hypothetical protein